MGGERLRNQATAWELNVIKSEEIFSNIGAVTSSTSFSTIMPESRLDCEKQTRQGLSSCML